MKYIVFSVKQGVQNQV